MLASPVLLALLAALLFGAATPLSKGLLDALPPFQLAGLLYLGAALGSLPLVGPLRTLARPWQRDARTRRYLLGAIGFGGVLGPLLLLFGLRLASSGSVSLWLNLEMVATVLLGHLFFRDPLHPRGWLAALGALGAALWLSLAEGSAGLGAGLLVAAACLCWGLDNHLTALIDGITPAQTTFWKGLVAGSVNLLLGLLLAPYVATAGQSALALGTGIFAYGLSLYLYITAAQQLGATRSQILFSSAPFFGLLLSLLLLDEPITPAQIGAALLFLASLALLLREEHEHHHTHHAVAHIHWHRGDHEHAHEEGAAPLGHTHWHEHEPTTHEHAHRPDLHHRHDHEE